jgi:histone deacetylase 11
MEARAGINIERNVTSRTSDASYLRTVKTALEEGIAAFKPDIIFYNAGTACIVIDFAVQVEHWWMAVAGTDILEGDPLGGGVGISAEGVIQRDQIVFEAALTHSIPVVMVLSGGYSRASATVVSSSVVNLLTNVIKAVV